MSFQSHKNFVILSVKSYPMQTRYSNISDLFSGTGCYPLENLSKDNRWVKLADSLDWDYIEVEYNKRLKNQKSGSRKQAGPHGCRRTDHQAHAWKQ